jgi:hypothetical protein
MRISDKDFSGSVVGKDAVDALKEITLKRITEKEKTRRLLIIITAILVIFAASIMVFGPEQKQGTNTIIGVVLLVLALGSIGASQFVLKAAGWEISTLEKNIQSNTDVIAPKQEGERVTLNRGQTMAS